MNEEKVSKLIKESRKKLNLTQEKFAQKYNVTPQAVSKWENGKNLPDITTLKEICKDSNTSIDSLLLGKKNNHILLIIIAILIIVAIAIISLINNKNTSFEFKVVESNCENFKTNGTIAYDQKTSHLHLSGISYCGANAKVKYNKITCTLYETEDKINKELENITYNKMPITLEEFLSTAEFDLANFSANCQKYKENSLYLEIIASNVNTEDIYKIPLTIKDNCKS